MISFVHDTTPQRVVFAWGALSRVAEEAARLDFSRALVVATPGSGARLGAKVLDLLGPHATGLHAQAVIHVPRAVAEAGVAEARRLSADGVVAIGGGAAIGLAKAIALETGLRILAIPTTYSGSEASPIHGSTEGDRKIVVRDVRVVPRTIIYDPELTIGLPAAISAASGMNAIAHCVEGLWIAERTPITTALAQDAIQRCAANLPRVVADGADREAREHCLVGSWLAGIVLTAGTALHHKLAHVLGGLGMPHAETHAIILPHVTRFNQEADDDAHRRLCAAFACEHPADAVARLLRGLPIPQRLRDIGFAKDKIDFAAAEVAKLNLAVPRPASADDARAILTAAY